MENQLAPSDSAQVAPATVEASTVPIVEAQSWVMGADGEVILVAAAPTATSGRAAIAPASCH